METIGNESGTDSEERQTLNWPIITTQESSLQSQNNSHFQQQNVTADEHIRFGSYVVLRHITTSRYLSGSPNNNETSTNNEYKAQIFASRLKSENELWTVIQAYGERRSKVGEVVPFNTQIRLKHIKSQRFLRSHPDYNAPISNQQ
ncbi:10086_t:CDS:2, partial [Funneliformis mosseae]